MHVSKHLPGLLLIFRAINPLHAIMSVGSHKLIYEVKDYRRKEVRDLVSCLLTSNLPYEFEAGPSCDAIDEEFCTDLFTRSAPLCHLA